LYTANLLILSTFSGLYGSDVIAAKVAGHDLKGVKCYFNAGVPLLRFPLVLTHRRLVRLDRRRHFHTL
jgi:hypothetical protein